MCSNSVVLSKCLGRKNVWRTGNRWISHLLNISYKRTFSVGGFNNCFYSKQELIINKVWIVTRRTACAHTDWFRRKHSSTLESDKEDVKVKTSCKKEDNQLLETTMKVLNVAEKNDAAKRIAHFMANGNVSTVSFNLYKLKLTFATV